jgi:molybdopterin synthase catalytic subunit
MKPMGVRIQAAAFDPYTELSAFAARNTGAAGAVASFVGLCRGGPGAVLELEHYPGFTEAAIEDMAARARGKFNLIDLFVIHRHGPVPAGDAIVLVAAMSPHRANAFAAVEALMDYLKTDAPFWKKEGEKWVEPTAEDRARRARNVLDYE